MKTELNPYVDIVLVGYERQENLGLRSIVANLQSEGYRAVLVPFNPADNSSVVIAIQQFQPRIVGFSLIFQYTLDEFGALMRDLRSGGVTAHFTAGGHFPSLRPKETLDLFPELDSIVRFEGEITVLELLEHLEHPDEWFGISGLAFRSGDTIRISESRALIENLDELPLLYRDEPQQMADGVKVAAMFGSRGCLFNCSFCSIRQFYGSAAGILRRVRSPQSVVNEMLALSMDRGVQFFSFQDDDFAARSPVQQTWLKSFLRELERTGLAGKIAWKISCRVDDLSNERLEMMQDHGLIAVYLGIESGNEAGLKTLNKHVSVRQNLEAVELLKSRGIAMSIGFMLFDPSSTFGTVRENIHFLKTVGEDGYFPINFCKMLPYAGTPIEDKLRGEGRLKGTVARPDYNFNDPMLDWYEFFVQKAFARRNFDDQGIVAQLQQADFDRHLDSFFHPERRSSGYGESLRDIIRTTNRLAVQTLEFLYHDVRTFGADFLIEERERLVALFDREWRGEMKAEVRLNELCMSTRVEEEATIE